MHSTIPDKYYRFAFDISALALLITHPDGTIVRANHAACTMLGRSEEELFEIGRCGIVDLNDPRLSHAIEERDIHGKTSTELNLIRKNGEIFPAQITSNLFVDENDAKWTIINIEDLSIEKLNKSIFDKLHEESIYIANHDYLTDTLNRRGFMDSLLKEMARSSRSMKSCGLAILDIDHFKCINDKYGHLVGDYILIYIAHKLKECLRPYDLIGRYGGDEFILCLPNLDRTEGEIIGERIRQYIENNPYLYDHEQINLTISIGIKIVRANDFKFVDTNRLLSDVDHLLYQSKKNRNTFSISD